MTKGNDIYERITQKIITYLERGELAWRKPWDSSNLAGQAMRPLRWNDIPYTGINTIMLWMTASESGFTSPYWMTFKQAKQMKACVRKGEKGTQVVYADKIVREDEDADGTKTKRHIPFLKAYTVFNASQIDGLPDAFYDLPEIPEGNPQERVAELEQFFQQTQANIYTGKQAAYSIFTDKIEMPPFECFIDAPNYYATLAHELTHWTRHPSRLDRSFGRKKWGDEGYAKEELVAELGSCFLGADLGFKPLPEEQHAAYIQLWLKVLKDDKRFIIQAASYAQRAVEYVTGLQKPTETVEAPTATPKSPTKKPTAPKPPRMS